MNKDELLKKADALMKEGTAGAREAARIYARLLESDPVNADLLSKANEAFYLGTDWEETDEGAYKDEIVSRQLIERAVRLQPDNAAVHRELGEFWFLWAEGRKEYYEKAAQEYKRALELDPQDAWSAIHLANSRRVLNITIDQAIEYLESARSDRPDQDWLLSRLSSMYYWKKDYVKALEMALLARSKLPEELDLMRKRVRLKESIDKSIDRLKLLIENDDAENRQES